MRGCQSQKTSEDLDTRNQECSSTQCWRDPQLVKRLLGIRRKIVNEQLRKTRMRLRDEMMSVSARNCRKVTSEAWEMIKKTRREVWNVENPKHAKKICHLVKRANNCGKHKFCKDLDSMWAKKFSTTPNTKPTQPPLPHTLPPNPRIHPNSPSSPAPR